MIRLPTPLSVSHVSTAGTASRSAEIQLLRMPEFSRMDIHEYVRSRKFIHIGRMMSISQSAGDVYKRQGCRCR